MPFHNLDTTLILTSLLLDTSTLHALTRSPGHPFTLFLVRAHQLLDSLYVTFWLTHWCSSFIFPEHVVTLAFGRPSPHLALFFAFTIRTAVSTIVMLRYENKLRAARRAARMMRRIQRRRRLLTRVEVEEAMKRVQEEEERQKKGGDVERLQ
ncbi:hypothetical protein M011DRAFT_464550 [Sporormia fimetaria CBS 119925]|uniref:DUF1746 domain-containing protein n=1 Tax=Sporormia fimetaria CBS 119925 TaxID=1340428 RepID=A0A6A6VNE4_9PLEO|nr:hypothetical protein M011DRAFT_464550 [Sporormia fimetaria CBS 119925]